MLITVKSTVQQRITRVNKMVRG